MAHDKPIPQNDSVEQNEAAKAGADASTKLSHQANLESRPQTDRVAVNDLVLADTSGDKFVTSPEKLGEKFGKAIQNNLPVLEQQAVLGAADFHVEQANKAGNPALAAAMQVYRDNLAQYVTTA